MVIRCFGQSDFELIIIEILKAQKLGHDGHIEITLELLQKFSQIILENISNITHLQNSSSDLYLDQSFDIILKNMSELDRINILTSSKH